MVLTIDTNILMLLDISINDYYLLALIYHKEKTPTITAEDILNLEKKEFIKDTPDGIILRTKGSNLFKDNTTNKKSSLIIKNEFFKFSIDKKQKSYPICYIG